MFSINRHLRAEAKVLLVVALIPLVLGLAVAVVWPQVEAWLASDRCLDAGGKYDYAANTCVLAQRRPQQ
jgi:phosphotransferase system  glucose/maltose/N-acetylglucosamine-specific IIC component